MYSALFPQAGVKVRAPCGAEKIENHAAAHKIKLLAANGKNKKLNRFYMIFESLYATMDKISEQK
jgi:hypothetical protein